MPHSNQTEIEGDFKHAARLKLQYVSALMWLNKGMLKYQIWRPHKLLLYGSSLFVFKSIRYEFATRVPKTKSWTMNIWKCMYVHLVVDIFKSIYSRAKTPGPFCTLSKLWTHSGPVQTNSTSTRNFTSTRVQLVPILQDVMQAIWFGDLVRLFKGLLRDLEGSRRDVGYVPPD